MKLSFFLILLGIIHVSAAGHAQEQRVSIAVSNADFYEVISQIEEQSEFMFFYKSEEINNHEKITLNVSEKPMTDVLNDIVRKQGLSYRIVGKYIILTPTQQPESRIITGIVTDSTGEPLIGANVFEKDTYNGVVTDIEGRFSISIPENGVLVVSYIGYITRELSATGQTPLNIILAADLQALDEVVVVGYGTQKKVNLTGAVSHIKGDLLENRVSSNVTNLLTGQVAGVTIVQNSGQPGADAGSLRVRGIGTLGNSEAMVVVDGVESTLSSVNPNDIEDISVLKDAAASSIYGVRAANGVILVTTKRGSIGKPVISYNGYAGWQSASRLPKFLGSADYAMLLNEAYTNDGLQKPYSDEEIRKFQTGEDPDHYPNSDWVSALVSENGFFHNHHLNMIGGTENIKYSISVGYHDKKGLVANTSHNKYNVRANLDAKVNNRLTARVNLAAFRDQTISPALDLSTIFTYNFREAPTTPIQFSNGNYALYLNEHNSVAEARIGGTQKAYNNNFQGNITLTYQLLDGLTWYGSGSSIFNLQEEYSFRRSVNYYTADSEDPVKASRSRSFNRDNKMLEINLQTYLDYDRTFGVHAVKGLLGYSQIKNQNRLLYAERSDLPDNNSLGEINAGDVTTQATEGNKIEYALRSVFGRINYTYDNRYLLEANIRYDGSSRFPKNNRFGTFPSFSVGWRISEEQFFNADFVDNLKVRASWGMLGNQEIGDYAYLNTYAFGKNYTFGNVLVPGISINDQMANTAITWEKTKQIDFGIDADFWNGKLGIMVDYFEKNTDDILLDLPVPAMLGVKAPTQNAGSVKNTGFELLFRHNNAIRDFRYFGSFNFTYVHNKITDLKGTDYPGRSVGDPIYNIYGYVFDKIFQSQEEIDNSYPQLWGAVPGDIKYKDLNGDGKIDEDDRESLGTSFPKINFGLRLGFEYRNFDFSTLLQGAGKVSLLVMDQVDKAFYNGGKVAEKHLDRWTPENPNGSYPRLSTRNSTKNQYTSTYWMQNASYLKMRNLQVGYTIPRKLLGNSGFSHLRVYFSGDNLFTLTGFEGTDPESPSNISGGRNYYPIAKSFSFGVNASF